MKEQNYSFLGSDMFARQAKAKNESKGRLALDWDMVAKIIKHEFANHPDLVVEAGLKEDWSYTGGVIFQSGKPTNDHYTYLSSNWAIPAIVLFWDGEDQVEVECFLPESESRFSDDSKWDETSLELLGIPLSQKQLSE